MGRFFNTVNEAVMENCYIEGYKLTNLYENTFHKYYTFDN